MNEQETLGRIRDAARRLAERDELEKPSAPASSAAEFGLPEADGLPELSAGVVLVGGGAKGAYQVGALQCLAEAGLRPAGLLGTSIGALNAAVVASHGSLWDGVRNLVEIWREAGAAARPLGRASTDRLAEAETKGLSPTQARSVLTALGSPVLRPGFLRDLVVRHVTSPTIPTWVSAFPSGDPDLVPQLQIWIDDLVGAGLGRQAEWFALHELPLPEVRDAVLASSALPLLLDSQRIMGRHYIDGGLGARPQIGLGDNTPIDSLVTRTGSRLVIVIHLRPGQLWDRHRISGAQILEIRPSGPLAPSGLGGQLAGMLDFSPERFEALRKLGYLDAQARVATWRGVLGAHQAARESAQALLEAISRLSE
ncbi:patatin-like phospholipase family protein [Actinomadura syzygii]|uniref:patatin-like phospholipase family protein n=1 Tax=Actinomadura syzygii TaxID=1427538 RepID=UPI001652814A|nr:patatin-like phospholipase family protein [Actinomadura syzygii]